MNVDDRDLLHWGATFPIVVGHRSPDGAYSPEGVGRAARQAVTHVPPVGIPAAVRAACGVVVLRLEMLGELDQKLGVGLGPPIKICVPVVVAVAVRQPLWPDHAESFLVGKLTEPADVVHPFSRAKVAVQHKHQRGVVCHSFWRVVDVFAGRGYAIDHRIKRFGVQATSVVCVGPLHVVQCIPIRTSLQHHLTADVTQFERKKSIAVFKQGERQGKTGNRRSARHFCPIPTVSPRVQCKQIVAPIFQAQRFGGRREIFHALVRRHQGIARLHHLVELPTDLGTPLSGGRLQGQFREFALGGRAPDKQQGCRSEK